MTTSQEYAERFDGWVPREGDELETPETAIRDFLKAVDSGWLGQVCSLTPRNESERRPV